MGYMWVRYGIDVGQICDRNRIGININGIVMGQKWDRNEIEKDQQWDRSGQ